MKSACFIGILVAIAISMISGNKEKSFSASKKADLRNLAVAQKARLLPSRQHRFETSIALGSHD